MRRPLLALAACALACGHAEVKPTPVPAPAPAPQPAPVANAGDGIRLEYRPQAAGKSMIEVASPPSARVEIFEGEARVLADTAPLALDASADHYYRVQVHLPSGGIRETKVQARAGQIASLRFADTGVHGPVALTHKEYLSLKAAIDREGSDKGKLAILETAARNSWFTSLQAGALIDAVTYRESKLQVVPLLKDRILDKENSYQIYQHFTYREDKQKVMELLEH